MKCQQNSVKLYVIISQTRAVLFLGAMRTSTVMVVMSVCFCQVAVYVNTIQLVITASAALVATMAIRYKELRMTADTVRARTKEPARSSWMRLSSVWSVPEDMEVSAHDRALI
jgi:hypothetical protein